MSKAGKIMWIPKSVVDELDIIKQEKNIPIVYGSNHIAFASMIQSSRVGREMEKIKSLDFRMPSLPDNEDYKKFKKKRLL